GADSSISNDSEPSWATRDGPCTHSATQSSTRLRTVTFLPPMVRRVPDRMSSLLPYWTSSLTDLFSPRAQPPLNGSYVPFGRYLYFLLSGRISTSIVQPSHAANGRLFGASLIEPGLRSFFTTYSPQLWSTPQDASSPAPASSS